MNTFIEKFSAQPLSVIVLALWLAGCGQGAPTNGDAGADQTGAQVSEAEPTVSRFGGVELAMPADTLNANPESNANRNAYFGDLHVHTNYSFDAFALARLRRLTMPIALLKARQSSIRQVLTCNFEHHWIFMR